MPVQSSLLIGRGAEEEFLRRLLTEDSARAAVVSGEPGVGKTVLIKRMCAIAVNEGWRVVRVQGSQAEEAFALGGLNQIAIGLRDFQAGLDGSRPRRVGSGVGR